MGSTSQTLTRCLIWLLRWDRDFFPFNLRPRDENKILFHLISGFETRFNNVRTVLILYRQFKSFLEVLILSGRFQNVRMVQYCLDGFNTVPTVLILYRLFWFCLEGFNSVLTVLKLFGQFQNCPHGFRTVRTVSKLSGQF